MKFIKEMRPVNYYDREIMIRAAIFGVILLILVIFILL
jgi:hypothetical protein